MVMAMGISALIGVALGWQFNVFVLIPTIILAGVGITVVQFMLGDSAGSAALAWSSRCFRSVIWLEA